MLNHKRQSTTHTGYSSSIQFKPVQPQITPTRPSKNSNPTFNLTPTPSLKPKLHPRFNLPLNLSNIRQPQNQNGPTQQLTETTLTDRTQKRNSRIDLNGISSSRSSHRLKHCQDMYQAHTQSIQFYMNQLRRREDQFVKKKDQLEKQHIQKVYYLERLLKTEINKNIKLDQELRRVKQEGKERCSESKRALRRPLSKLSNDEVQDLFKQLKRELDSRYQYDDEISQIKGHKSRYSNDLVLSYSRTDESLLLGDVARHF